jgi:hypothetical protein
MQAENMRITNVKQRLYAAVRANVWLIASLLLAIIVAFLVQWPHISDPYAVQDDFRKFFWMHRYEDPNLFPDDPQISSAIKHVDLGLFDLDVDIKSPMYNLIFYLASPFFSINLTNKLLVFPLILISVFLVYKIGENGDKPRAGFALAAAFIVLILSFPNSVSVAAGLQRSFAVPILLTIVYSLMQKRFWIAAIALAVGGLIYPPVMLLGLLTYLPSLFDLKVKPFRLKIHWRRAYPLIGLTALAIVVLIPALSAQIRRINFDSVALFGGFQRLLDDPRHQLGGRYSLFDPVLYPWVGRAGLFTRIDMLWWAVTLALLSLAFMAIRPSSWREFPRPLKNLLWASFIGYGLAWLGVTLVGSFVLYLPSRYLRASVFLVFLAFLFMSAEKVVPNALNRLKQLDKKTVWLPFLAAAGVCFVLLWLIQNDVLIQLSTTKVVRLTWNVVLAAGILAGGLVLRILSQNVPADRLRLAEEPKIKKWQWLAIGILALISSWSYISHTEIRDLYLTTDDELKNVMAFLGSLPVESRIMGQPCTMDAVALLSKRSVLWSCEQPSNRGAKVEEDTRNAYYGESLIEIFQFCQRYDVDYLYVDSRSFLEGDQYALLAVPDEQKIYDDNGHFVMPCRPSSGTSDIPVELAQMEEADLMWLAVDPMLVQQGSNTDIHLYWENLNPGVEIPQLCFSLNSQAGNATNADCMPLGAASDIRQLGDKTFAFTTYELEVSPYLNSGKYAILVEVASSNANADEPATGVIGEINLNAKPRTFASHEDQGPVNLIASWGDQIALIDATTSLSEDRSLVIDFTWQALARTPKSNKVLVHLIGATGPEPVAQADAVPRNWTYPTNWWEKGEIVTDTLTISIDGISPGSYQLMLGLYDEETLERLPLDDPISSGEPTNQDVIKIAELEL